MPHGFYPTHRPELPVEVRFALSCNAPLYGQGVTHSPDHPNLLDVEIRDLSNEGDGIGQSQGRIVFVEGALPGERVETRLIGGSRGMLRGELRTLHQASPERRQPPCILAADCGGCSLQHWSDRAQALWKEQKVQQSLTRLGGLSITVEPILAAEAVLGYRNRAIIPIQSGPHGFKAGFYRRHSHDVVNMNHCPVLDPRLDALIAPLKQDLEATGWSPYNEETRSGVLRHLVLRIGAHSGEILLGLVVRDASLDEATVLAEEWMERWPQVVGVVLNLQPKPTNTLLGPHNQLLAGRPWLLERFADRTFQIGLDTFFQVHTAQAECLIPLLRAGLQLKSGQVLLDGFCGIGTLSLPLLSPGVRLIGIEHQASSVERARDNARLNGLENAEFVAGGVDERLGEWLPMADALLLDPPRKGLSESLCAAIAKEAPNRIAYVSCNPATLARDLQRLTVSGQLRLESVQPIDFFPQTSHCEALALLVSSAS